MVLGPMANHWLDSNHYHLDLLRLRRQFGHDSGEHAHPAPALPAVIKRLGRAIVERRVRAGPRTSGGSTLTPHQPIALYVYYPTQDLPVIDPGPAPRLRKVRTQTRKLRLGQPKICAHGTPPFWKSESRRAQAVKLIYRS